MNFDKDIMNISNRPSIKSKIGQYYNIIHIYVYIKKIQNIRQELTKQEHNQVFES